MGFAEEPDDFADAMGGGGGHGDDRLLDSELGFEFEDFLGRADHGNIVDAGVPFVLVVVEKGDGLETQAALEGKLMGEGGAGVASANDGNPAAMVLLFLGQVGGSFRGWHGEGGGRR